jgi:hypothetical protein
VEAALATGDAVSQFPTPTMQCRECGKPIEGHGDYCHPFDVIAGGICVALILLGGVAMIVAIVITGLT